MEDKEKETEKMKKEMEKEMENKEKEMEKQMYLLTEKSDTELDLLREVVKELEEQVTHDQVRIEQEANRYAELVEDLTQARILIKQLSGSTSEGSACATDTPEKVVCEEEAAQQLTLQLEENVQMRGLLGEKLDELKRRGDSLQASQQARHLAESRLKDLADVLHEMGITNLVQDKLVQRESRLVSSLPSSRLVTSASSSTIDRPESYHHRRESSHLSGIVPSASVHSGIRSSRHSGIVPGSHPASHAGDRSVQGDLQVYNPSDITISRE